MQKDDRQPAYPQGGRLSWVSNQHLLQLRPYTVYWGEWCSRLLKIRAANKIFRKRRSVKSWGSYMNRLQKAWKPCRRSSAAPDFCSKKRKALYFAGSTVLFWWRIAGSNRWPLACHASALPNHALTHPHTKVRGWTIFGVDSFYSPKAVSQLQNLSRSMRIISKVASMRWFFTVRFATAKRFGVIHAASHNWLSASS